MTTAGEPPRGTFRDPAGSLEIRGEEVLRHIRPEYAESTLEFLQSPLFSLWEQRGDLVSSQIISREPLVLRHPRIEFPSYPWEWTLSQWRAAADLTLRLQSEAVAEGWVLKDATPLNILFEGTRPVLVDVLSFERRVPESPVWLAQGQFVRTFLLPLLAHEHLGWALAMSASRRDGFEPSEIFRHLAWRKRYRPKMLMPVTLPALLEKRAQESQHATSRVRRQPEIASQVLKIGAEKMRRRIAAASPRRHDSHWARYEQTASHYDSTETAAKQAFVRSAITKARPRTVLDVGANTGTYSLMAAESGARVVALEMDEHAAESIYQRAATAQADVMPLIGNLAWPTPAYGWENSETRALLPRMEDAFDLVMMLAVVHHLLLKEQATLAMIATLAARLTRDWLLLEWVPASDPMFRKLLRGRDALYGALDETQWHTAAGAHFVLQQRDELANGRVMLLYRKRGGN